MPPLPTGPAVDRCEDLYRAILYPTWWYSEEARPSSVAFDDEVLSVDIASRTTPETILQRFHEGSGLVSFNCGTARDLGFDTRDEPDPMFPKNVAHAHVYFGDYESLGKNGRKTRARRLASMCTTIAEPAFI